MKILMSLVLSMVLNLVLSMSAFAAKGDTVWKANLDKVLVTKAFQAEFDRSIDWARVNFKTSKAGKESCTLELLHEICPKGEFCIRGGTEVLEVYNVALETVAGAKIKRSWATSEHTSKAKGYELSLDRFVNGKVEVSVVLNKNDEARLNLIGSVIR